MYAGVPDMAVGPHWYSSFEMAASRVPGAVGRPDHAFLANQGTLAADEQARLEEVILHSREPDWQYSRCRSAQGGQGPASDPGRAAGRRLRLMLECGAPENFSMPQHTAEYCNTLRWYFDAFDHPHQVKLLFVAGGMVNTAAHNQAADPNNGPRQVRPLRGVEAGTRHAAGRLHTALMARDTDESLALVAAYVRNGYAKPRLIQLLALASAKFGNDPHNQEICLCLLEDYVQEHGRRPRAAVVRQRDERDGVPEIR